MEGQAPKGWFQVFNDHQMSAIQRLLATRGATGVRLSQPQRPPRLALACIQRAVQASERAWSRAPMDITQASPPVMKATGTKARINVVMTGIIESG